jgi:rhodanese-related sulfurtransferase
MSAACEYSHHITPHSTSHAAFPHSTLTFLTHHSSLISHLSSLIIHHSSLSSMEITVQELRQKLEAGEKFIFIDVREPYEYEEFNLGAQLYPLGGIVNLIMELNDNKDDEIVVHCRSGARSGQAQAMLMSQGFTNVRNLKGGVLAWMDAYGKEKV